MKRARTTSRKKEHIDILVSEDVAFHSKTSGFESLEFVHNALPELDISEIETSVQFLGKTISFPLIVSSMTGGYRDALRINRLLAEVCEERQLAMGVGSQRQALENDIYHNTFSVVREVAKSIPIFGNIGAAEIATLKDPSKLQKLVDLIEADGFAIHLNPLQEFLQPEGNARFRGVLRGIEMVVKGLAVPIIVKEVGAGISSSVARQLLNAGVRIIDVAGAGGTSWAAVEIYRRSSGPSRTRSRKASQKPADMSFWDWGIPTVDSLRQVSQLRKERGNLTLISSGGISCGFDIAKSIALGADVAGAARPLLIELENSGKRGLMKLLDLWTWQFRGAMFLTGSRTISDLKQQKLVERSQSISRNR